MKKRLALAQSLLHDPELLIMDEPASGLDPQGMRYFRDLIRFLNGKGKTVFLSSHLLSEVEQLCEHVGIIDRGRIVAADSIANLSSKMSAGVPIVLHVPAERITDEAIAALTSLPSLTVATRTANGLYVPVQSRVERRGSLDRTPRGMAAPRDCALRRAPRGRVDLRSLRRSAAGRHRVVFRYLGPTRGIARNRVGGRGRICAPCRRKPNRHQRLRSHRERGIRDGRVLP